MKYKFVDIYNLDELPVPEKGKRFLEFMGGEKKYRCYLADKDMPRCDFYKNNIDLIDKMLHPIYKNRRILVAQDNTFPIPGFYIISSENTYNNITEIPDVLLLRSAFILKQLRKTMKNILCLKYVNVYYEEKHSKSTNVHFGVMPKNDTLNLEEKLYELDLNEYLKSFKFNNNIKLIKEYNKKIIKYFEKNQIKKEDDKLFNKLDTEDKKINLCISNQCFIKCSGCYNNFCYNKLIECEKIIEFLEYAKSKGLKKVTLSGGDPLAREDITIIIKKCIELNFKINLDTVGLSFVAPTNIFGTDKIINQFDDIKLLKKISMIGIPLDGSSDDVISTFRIGKDNLFAKQIEVLNFFEKNNIKICVNTVYHKQNKNDIEKIYNIIKKYKCIKKWQVFQFMPIGPLGKINEEKYSVNVDDFINVADQFKKLENKDLKIEFKPAIERSHNYMLVNSSGLAYKVDLNNNKEVYGNLQNKETWDEIINHLC